MPAGAHDGTICLPRCGIPQNRGCPLKNYVPHSPNNGSERRTAARRASKMVRTARTGRIDAGNLAHLADLGYRGPSRKERANR